MVVLQLLFKIVLPHDAIKFQFLLLPCVCIHALVTWMCMCVLTLCSYTYFSCSQFLDNSVFVWDVRRPFIPFASFVEHSDDVTGKCLTTLLKCAWTVQVN